MSAVQSPLETKEMSETTELMESFETVDEDKDSDEESFHLFLEGDEEHNKSDDKITNEFEDEANEEINEEGQRKSPTSVLDKENTESVEEKKDNDDGQLTFEEDIPCDKVKEEKLDIEEADNTQCTQEENLEDIISEKTISDENKLNSDASSENEDEILNKHINEGSEDLGNSVEELDPNIEESLLNECDEIENHENNKISGEEKLETISVSASENKQTEVSDSVVEEQTVNTDQNLPVNGEDSSETTEENIEKNIVSVTNSQKCDENSSSSNPDTDDLLDISMIKDSAQDDADIAEDARQLEQENDDSNSKGIDNIENTDDTSNSDNSDEDGRTESEILENVQNEISDSEKQNGVQESDRDNLTPKNYETDKEKDNVEITNSEDSETCEQKTEKLGKRNISNSDIEPSSKRIRLVDTLLDDVEMDSWDITELQSLISFSKFMTKSHLKKLTRADLEEFCIQKLCEAILHKSELGETNHQLKIQEQTIETLRRDQTVLTKQIKDLEIVNKKLMNEILASNGIKPVLPVKITRSVGLQVRLPTANDPNLAKRRSLPTPHKITATQTQASTPKTRNVPNNIPNRTIMQPSPQKQPTTLLTQALQNRTRTPVKTVQVHNNNNNAAQRTNVTPKPIPPPEKRPRTSGSFIDLTDEDDKKSNNKNVKSIVPQGVRINSVPKSTASSVLPSVVSTTTPQLMYVVQPNSQLKQGVLTTSAGQKALLVNFQPTNGVINTLNSSSVSVIPKVTGTIPIKPKPSAHNSLLKANKNSTPSSNKHPAPLPNPPAVQGPNDKNLKAIPPKPVLSIRKTATGIILQWRMPYDLGNYEAIASYQLYAYQETSAVPSTDMWRKVGDVKAMALPMACTLTQFADKNKYYFAVRPVDIHKRIGKFSHPVLSE
ncbi:activating transcription factor 7-interacting protein 1 [Coccinella septempunctata]|uniref:activating transcription factor 7-interacting protein 1 n=1 Tax=Coccinella septempunctata TaxID=41139 RepID=UPI001D067F71|nr:activating transcription factor 7-interacting protein 1 [Coccinella septempunctata]